MHVFRCLNITWRQHAGASPFEAQKAAGHARPSTTWMYTITDDEREEQHVDWIWKRIGGEPSRSECRKLRPTASEGSIG